MLKMITEKKQGRTDILAPIKLCELTITDLEKNVLTKMPAPHGGWTHFQLMFFASLHEDLMVNGCDVYLGQCWIGSTEM